MLLDQCIYHKNIDVIVCERHVGAIRSVIAVIVASVTVYVFSSFPCKILFYLLCHLVDWLYVSA